MSNSDKNSREKITGDSEARYREIFELFPGATFEMDKEGNIVFASQKAFESFGYNQSDLKEGLNVFQMFIPSDRERVKVNLQKRLEGNSKGMNEYTALRKDGSTFPIIAQANRIFRENEVVGLRGVIIDITERKKVEEELRSSEKKYRILFEDSPISLWEEDYSKLKIHIDSLKDSGVKDFDKYFNDNPDELIKCTRLIQVLDVNKATLVLYKAENKAELFGNLEKFFTEESFKIFKKEVTARAKGERFFETEGFAKTLHDEKLYIQLKSSILPGYENNWSKVLVSVIDISERKKAEEEIYKFKAITENANFGTAISDLNGNLTYVNKNFAAMHGYGVEEIIGKNLIIFHNEEQLIEVEKINRQLKETGGYSSKEVWHTHKDGSVFPTLMNGIVINDDKGNPSFLAATAIDITERKRAEEVLRQSKEKYQVLVENAPSVLWKTSIKGITVFISTNIKEIYGYTPEEIYADSENIWFGRIHNDDLKEVEKEFELLFSEGKNFDVEYRIKRKDGEWIWARDIANVVCSENGELFAYGVFTDITERKKAEKKLQESEENARALLNATTEIVLLINPDETVAAANESAAKGFGLTPEELVGRNLFDLMTPEVAERRRGFLRKIIEHKMPLRDEDENRGRRFDYSAFPILDDNGTLRLIALFAQDITERKRVEESLKNSETRYRLLFETSADGIIIADTETKDFKYVNPSICKMLGYKEEEIIGMSVKDIHPKDSIEHVNSEFEAQSKGEKELAKEIPCLKKDGTIINVDISAKMTIIDGRKCNIGFFRDITERKTIEIRNKARLNLLDRLRKTKSIDECLETGCKAIYEAELYRRAVLTLHSEDRNITNLGHVGLDEETVKAALNAPAPDDDFTKRLTQAKFRVSNSYFIPEESGVIYTTTARDVPQKKDSRLEDSSWKSKDELFVPLKPGIDRVEGWLSVDTPFDGNRPTKEIIIILEEIVDIVGRKVSEISSVEALNQESKGLQEKNIALHEVLGHIEEEKLKIRKEVSNVVNQVMLPLLNKLKNPDGTMDLKYYDLLIESMNKLASLSNSPLHLYSKLTSREIEICNLIKSGCTSKEISQTLNISWTTVHKHRETIRKKMELTNKGINLASYLRNI